MNPKTTDRKYSYLTVQVPEPLRSEILAFGQTLPAHLLAGDGLETDPHITVRWGFSVNEPKEFIQLLGARRRQGHSHSMNIRLGDLTVFSGMGKRPDVLKVSVQCERLHSLHSLFGVLPNKKTFDYNPHLTIAFMKPGSAKDYATNFFNGKTFFANSILFHSKDRQTYEIAL